MIRKDCPCRLDLRISSDAADALVPATPIRLVLDEVVQNAEMAVCGRPAARIKIVARVINGRIFGQRRLFVEVNDNGVGMTPEVLARARTPFFSTKAGSHTGLGLTGCARMLAALRGKLEITSQPWAGTSVRISFPI